MRARFFQYLDDLRTGFWFVPSMMLFLAALLALGLLYVDERFDPGMKSSIAWAYSGGPEGARSLLSTIAGSMITAASVTFSLASVALSIASQQYGSRVLRNFMRDRVTQVLLGAGCTVMRPRLQRYAATGDESSARLFRLPFRMKAANRYSPIRPLM